MEEHTKYITLRSWVKTIVYVNNYIILYYFLEPPTEEDLVQNTLWPEIQKLYGHVYEVYCLASSNDHKWLASAAKATSLELASIIIW